MFIGPQPWASLMHDGGRAACGKKRRERRRRLAAARGEDGSDQGWTAHLRMK
eukprot:CAMPEP_0206584326 /NCGR_PEP_ID=MMETSP0325_2-20121206/35651_1 /ASSEMBLY_ACC=CAM_ASM_000347 /TAXON_ID=2866 /ORGANISM="Crypthecodinium cohnii, Strain Seligo" /LENGTH=51 /DNA_ID=CAMNT_0054091453 /DNA_START=742 /DNA_END=897 /DNA_ORIENTATION=-